MSNAEARFNNSLRPRKLEGSLGRTAQDVHLDSHTAPELYVTACTNIDYIVSSVLPASSSSSLCHPRPDDSDTVLHDLSCSSI